jgi:hypothetical protein
LYPEVKGEEFGPTDEDAFALRVPFFGIILYMYINYLLSNKLTNNLFDNLLIFQ